MKSERTRLGMSEIDLSESDRAHYYNEFVQPIAGTRAEEALRTLVDQPDPTEPLTLDRWGELTADWIAQHTDKTPSYDDSSLITANDVQKKVGRAGAVRQLEADRPSQKERTIVQPNEPLAEWILETIEDIGTLDPFDQYMRIRESEYWDGLNLETLEKMRYLSAAVNQGRTFNDDEAVELGVQNGSGLAALEAEVYAKATTNAQVEVSCPDVQLRKFGRRRQHEDHPDWLDVFPLEQALLDRPGGMGNNYDECVLLLDFSGVNLQVSNRRLLKDLYDPLVKTLFAAKLYEGEDFMHERQKHQLSQASGDPDDPGNPYVAPRYFSDVTFPNQDTFRIAGVYRFKN